MRWELAGLALLLAALAGAMVGDLTGLVRCEQHHQGVVLEMEALGRSLESWRARHGQLPASLDLLAPDFDGSLPRDYWRRPFLYSHDEAGWELRSLGRDGRPGGIGEDADIVVRDDGGALRPG